MRLNPIPLSARLRLRRRREKLGWPLTRVAEKLNISQEQVSRWETGLRGIDARELTRWAHMLNLEATITEAKVTLTKREEVTA